MNETKQTVNNNMHPLPALSPQAVEEMARYNITDIPMHYFHVAGFRYQNLADAVAYAKSQKQPLQ